MLTTSHWIIWYLLFRKKWKKIWKYSVIWALIPDMPMIFSILTIQITAFLSSNSNISHDTLHDGFIDKAISPITHSIFLWIIIFFVFLFIKNNLTKFKVLALWIWWLSHIIIDFLTHQGKWTWNHLYPLDIEPIAWLFYYLNPYFIIWVHLIWIIIFWPKIYKYFITRSKKWDLKN